MRICFCHSIAPEVLEAGAVEEEEEEEGNTISSSSPEVTPAEEEEEEGQKPEPELELEPEGPKGFARASWVQKEGCSLSVDKGGGYNIEFLDRQGSAKLCEESCALVEACNAFVLDRRVSAGCILKHFPIPGTAFKDML